MTPIAILTDDEKISYDTPATLTAEARGLCFSVSADLEETINRLRTDSSKIGFLLQYGYFAVSKRFFMVELFHEEDIQHVSKILGISGSKFDLLSYKNRAYKTHQTTILKKHHYKALTQDNLKWLEHELKNQINRLIAPRKLFFSALNLLNEKKITLPSYHLLSRLIAKHYIGHEAGLLNIIRKNITTQQRETLMQLLHINSDNGQGILHQFKIINQSLKPKAIQSSLDVFKALKSRFDCIRPLIKALSLTRESCDYYATWVKKAKLSQLKQLPDENKLLLYLVAFCQHQYYSRQDAFADIFMKSVQSIKNRVNSWINRNDKLSRKERREAICHMTKKNQNYEELIEEITEIVKSTVLNDTGKVKNITKLLNKEQALKNEKESEKTALFEQSLKHMANNSDYWNALEKLSVKFQNRVSGILKILDFNPDNSNKDLMSTISHYKLKNGKINHSATLNIFRSEEKSAIKNAGGKFRISLYKALFFIHVSDGIKSGDLNLKYSSRYLSIDDYLIDKNTWENNREELLQLANLSHFSNYTSIIDQLKQRLGEKYETVNRRFEDKLNPYLSFNKQGKYHVTTPALDDKQTEHIGKLLSQSGQMPILKILTEINNQTRFMKCLTHHNIKNSKRYPNHEACMAGLIGLGCNIGVSKMSQISAGVNTNTLINTVNWHFSINNIEDANKQILALINQLSLPNAFIVDNDNKHSSSDGQKVNVAVESLLANFSFKYFGKSKGVSIYTFIDERQVLFYSTVISASDREAAYVIDGLVDNEVVKTDIHSTDTHGYTELIFGVTHFLETAFAPRIKNIGKQNIYAFSAKSTYAKKGYKILPSRTIQQSLITEHWDDILRFMVTVKLKHTPASQLFKRLNSYMCQHPLYKALKEFGRIIKSIFILTYLDDVKLRQRIEKQLNRVELANRFSNAVFYANNSEFKQGTAEEQKIAVACKTLIQNSIVLWNYLYLGCKCISGSDRPKVVYYLNSRCWQPAYFLGC